MTSRVFHDADWLLWNRLLPWLLVACILRVAAQPVRQNGRTASGGGHQFGAQDGSKTPDSEARLHGTSRDDWNAMRGTPVDKYSKQDVRYTDSSVWCGVHDRLGPQQYALGPSKWNKTDMTFRILNFPPNLSYKDVRYALLSAFYVWSDVAMLSFREIQTGSADISIQFSIGDHRDGYPFDGKGKVVAHAFFPGEDRGGDVHFDADETWTLGPIDGVNLFMVAAHEIGHALGLAHSTVPGALMSPYHHGYIADFVLPDDDTAAIQQLYGVRMPRRRRIFKAPTASTTSPAPTPTRSVTPHDVIPTTESSPDPCWTALDAISLIRGEIFAFKGKWFWRITFDELGQLVADTPTRLSRFWFGFPTTLDKVDAVFERPTDGRIVFFSGDRYWEFSDNRADLELSTVDGRPLTDLGLPSAVRYIDAAFVWGYNRRTYIISGRSYWRLDHTGRSVERYGYPRDMNVWTGVKLPVDAAFSNRDGRTYFFSGDEFWEFSDARMHVRHHGYPLPVGQHWLGCQYRRTTARPTVSMSRGTSYASLPHFVTFIVSILASRCYRKL